MRRYSSVSAFLAHYEALRASRDRGITPDEQKILATMDRLLGTLRPDEREAILSSSDSPATARHRERGLLRLRRELLASGAIDG